MSRTLFEISQFQDLQGDISLLSVLEPRELQTPSTRFSVLDDDTLKALRTGPLVDVEVDTAGNRLWTGLASLEKARMALERATSPGVAGRHPLYFYIRDSLADDLPFECLHVQAQGFPALDIKTPIARLANRETPEVMERVLEGPLRIVAVLSAKGMEHRAEWLALRRSVESSQLDVQLMVLSGDHQLVELIQSIENDSITAEVVPTDTQSLINRIKDLAPNVVHMFCHGHRGDLPYLTVAKPRAFQPGMEGAPSTEFVVEARHLVSLYDESLWVVLLNACNAGAAGDNGEPGHGSSLLWATCREGVPAVIGYRRPITPAQSAVFAGAFYTSLFRAVMEASEDPSQVLEWAKLLPAARSAMVEAVVGDTPVPLLAPRHAVWTLPVLYVSCKGLRLKAGAISPEAREELREAAVTYRQMLNTLRVAGAGPDVLLPIQSLIDDTLARLGVSS